jgi:hypothetical protein
MLLCTFLLKQKDGSTPVAVRCPEAIKKDRMPVGKQSINIWDIICTSKQRNQCSQSETEYPWHNKPLLSQKPERRALHRRRNL